MVCEWFNDVLLAFRQNSVGPVAVTSWYGEIDKPPLVGGHQNSNKLEGRELIRSVISATLI